MDVSDLVKRFGGNAPAENTTGDEHLFSDLAKRFSEPVETAPAETPQQTETQQSNSVGTSNAPTGEYRHKLYSDAVAEEYAAAKGQFSQGINEISSNRPASGLGNAVMGAFGVATSPVTPIVKSATEIINKALPGAPNQDYSRDITGKALSNQLSKDASTGEKAFMILPIKGAGTFAKAQLPSNIAIERLIEAIGKENLPEVLKAMKADERISPMDKSNSVLQVAQKLAVTEGPHQNVLNKFSTERVGTSNEAVRAAFDENLGVPVNALEKINSLKQKARDTGKTLINPLVEKSKPADITGIISDLESGFGSDPVAAQTLKQLKSGQPIQGPGLSPYQQRLFELRQDLRGNWSDKENMFLDVKGEQGLHEKQIALRREAQDLIDSPDPANRRLGNRLMNIRDKYVEAIDKASPGYKEALGKYADDMELQEGFERGFSLFGKSPKITNRPEFLIDELKNVKSEVKEAMKEGGRIAIDSQTRGFKNSARKGEDLVSSEFNADKIKALYGEKEANKLISKLQNERDISNTDTKLYQNSQTAMRLKNDNRVPQNVDPNNISIQKYLPFLAEAAGLAYTGQMGLGVGSYLAAKGIGRYGITPATNAYRNKQNLELTKLLTAKGEDRQMVIKILEDRLAPPKGTMQVIKHLALPVLPP